jgi:hypothetical protein
LFNNNKKGEIMAYIQKHWRGEHSLAQSYWITNVFINISMGVVGYVIAVAYPVGNFGLSELPALVWVFFRFLIILPWQLVGLWRCANRHSEKTGKKFWSVMVKISIVVTPLVAIGEMGNYLTP